MEMLRAAGLKKYYVTETYEVRALDDVTLSVPDGEFLAVVGTSGSGKTTLLNLLGGLDVPTEGGVWIRGSSLRDMNPEERTIFRRRNIGFVFQQYNLVPVLSIYENIVLPLRLDGAAVDSGLQRQGFIPDLSNAIQARPRERPCRRFQPRRRPTRISACGPPFWRSEAMRRATSPRSAWRFRS